MRVAFYVKNLVGQNLEYLLDPHDIGKPIEECHIIAKFFNGMLIENIGCGDKERTLVCDER